MWQRYHIQGIGFTLHIWDTAGQEKFRSLSQAYYRGARACIAAFDLGVPETLDHCQRVSAPLAPFFHTFIRNTVFDMYVTTFCLSFHPAPYKPRNLPVVGHSCNQWVQEVIAENQATKDSGDFCVFLVGCKADQYKVVDRDEAEALAQKLNAEYFEVSAKTGE
mmetsp:Transcript_33796/g.40840  ORF Transcript_33796/g.40840 Transcript_33796/m.40840 type:complete len:163 (+) Transcript_33796:2542-3030(+)